MGLLTGQPRGATVIAESEALVLPPRQARLRGGPAFPAGARGCVIGNPCRPAGGQRRDAGLALGGGSIPRHGNARQRSDAAHPGFLRTVDQTPALTTARQPRGRRGQAAASRSSRLSRKTPSSAPAVESQVKGSRGNASSAAARLCPTSTTSTPSGFRNFAEWAMMVLTASSPSSPPASAICGSCAYSGGSSSIAMALRRADC